MFMDAAAIIKDVRARAGLTQAALAHAAGTSQPTLAAYESGAKSPSVRTLDKIVRAAGFSLDAVLHTAPPAGGAVLAEVRARQADIRKAAAGYGIRNVRVFGSVARNEARSESDVDFLIDALPEEPREPPPEPGEPRAPRQERRPEREEPRAPRPAPAERRAL